MLLMPEPSANLDQEKKRMTVLLTYSKMEMGLLPTDNNGWIERIF